MAIPNLCSNLVLRRYRNMIKDHQDRFIHNMPKIEMHVHIEGTMSPELRWALAQRHKIPILNYRTGMACQSLLELKGLYRLLDDVEQGGVEGGMPRFFALYYGGFEVLKHEDDFYHLAIDYFQRAASMNVRYCEPFFDPQGHTRRGVSLAAMLAGFRRAQLEAAERFNVQSQWVMCFLRDMSPESALEHYLAALPYRDMIIGVGLDSLETDRPPLLFGEVFSRAREDGFRITCHCDVGDKDTLRNIDQVIHHLGGTGADRVDHGLDAVDELMLLEALNEKDMGMTICPWGYLCYSGQENVLDRVRRLHSAGVKIAIGSDDPAYMEDVWLSHSLYLLRVACGFTNDDFVKLQRNAIEVCWAPDDTKTAIMNELKSFSADFKGMKKEARATVSRRE